MSGLILAGGRSHRFGSDKARFVVEGKQMITRVFEAAAPLCAEVLVSVADRETRYRLPSSARYVMDHKPGAGPLGGLHAGLLEARMSWVLAVACDLAYLTTEALCSLLDACSDDKLDAVVAISPDGRLHPLCACYHRRVIPIVEENLAAERLAMHALLNRLSVSTVSLPELALRNVNAVADLLTNRTDDAR